MHDISIISIFFTVVLALVCLYLTITPLFKWDSFLSFGAKDEEIAVSKESLLSTLNELEFEYKMDKISYADYKSLKRQYEEQVAIIMKEEEEFVDKHIDKDVLAEVEREIEAIEAQMRVLQSKKGEGK